MDTANAPTTKRPEAGSASPVAAPAAQELPQAQAAADTANFQTARGAALLMQLATTLAERRVDWCALRGAANFPVLAPGSDLDVLTTPAQADVFEQALADAAEATGFHIWERVRCGHLRQFFLHASGPADGPHGDGPHGKSGHTFVELDLHTAELCYGVPFLLAADIMQSRGPTGGPAKGQSGPIDAPRPAMSALIDFCGPFLSGGVVSERYATQLALVQREHPDELARLFAKLFGAKRAELFVEAARWNSWSRVQARAKALRRALLTRALVRRPLSSLTQAARFLWSARVSPWLRPRGRFISLLGTDGTGKSTLLEALVKRLEPVFRGGLSKSWHLRPGVLPQINTLVHLGHTTYSLEDMAEPHRAKPSGPIGSNLRVAYYFLDYVLGYVLRVLPRRRRNSLLVFDRYFYDYCVDPERARVRRGTWLARALFRWVPRPDCVLVCSAPVEVVQARKQELPATESARQIEAYKQLAQMHGFSVIDCAKPLEQALDQALDAIFAPLEARK